MKPRWHILALAAAALALAGLPESSATTLTYRMGANERACFYAEAKKNEKVAFYFAVQSGSSFEVDYAVTDPQEAEVISGNKERQVDYVFTAQVPGDYMFCFFNTHSAAAPKLIDFDITVEQELADWEAQQKATKNKQVTALESGVDNLGSILSGVQRYQKYLRTRENRNMYTVQATESSIFWFAIASSVLMLLVPVAQVLIVRTFFSSKSTHYSSSYTSVSTLRGAPAAGPPPPTGYGSGYPAAPGPYAAAAPPAYGGGAYGGAMGSAKPRFL